MKCLYQTNKVSRHVVVCIGFDSFYAFSILAMFGLWYLLFFIFSCKLNNMRGGRVLNPFNCCAVFYLTLYYINTQRRKIHYFFLICKFTLNMVNNDEYYNKNMSCSYLWEVCIQVHKLQVCQVIVLNLWTTSSASKRKYSKLSTLFTF